MVGGSPDLQTHTATHSPVGGSARAGEAGEAGLAADAGQEVIMVLAKYSSGLHSVALIRAELFQTTSQNRNTHINTPANGIYPDEHA